MFNAYKLEICKPHSRAHLDVEIDELGLKFASVINEPNSLHANYKVRVRSKANDKPD